VERKKIILFLLLTLLAGSIIYRVQHPFEQKRVSRLNYGNSKASPLARADQTPRGKDGRRVSGGASLSDIKLFLDPVKHSGVVIRDPFFEKEIQVKHAAPSPVPTPTSSTQWPKPVEDPVQKVKRELSQFRVFGSFESNGETVLFMERGRDILVVRKGDWIDGRFQLKDISSHSISIWASEIGEDVHIALDE